MSNSDVPLVVLTKCKSEDTTDTVMDDDDDINDIHDVNDVIFTTPHSILGNNNEEGVTRITVDSAPDKVISNNVSNHHHNHHHSKGHDVRRTQSLRAQHPPSYHSIFAGRGQEGGDQLEKTRLSLPTSARDALRRLSDVWRHGTPRSSMTSIYPESPTSVTTLTGFIIRDKNAEGETQTRQVLRLAAVLLICGIAILALEIVTSLQAADHVTGYSYAGIGAGALISATGALGLLAATRKDCPHKYFSYYKGLSLVSLLMGVVVLCGTLANLDVRWLSHSSKVANLAEIALYIAKVLLAGVDIAAALASIYI